MNARAFPRRVLWSIAMLLFAAVLASGSRDANAWIPYPHK